jgi:hypothetical protein
MSGGLTDIGSFVFDLGRKKGLKFCDGSFHFFTDNVAWRRIRFKPTDPTSLENIILNGISEGALREKEKGKKSS